MTAKPGTVYKVLFLLVILTLITGCSEFFNTSVPSPKTALTPAPTAAPQTGPNPSPQPAPTPAPIPAPVSPPVITTKSLPDGDVGVSYSQTLTVSGGSSTYTWSLSAGSLPAGLSLAAATGVISGTPTAAGTSEFTVQVSDGTTVAVKPLSIKIGLLPLSIRTTSLPNGDVGAAYSQALSASGGSGIYIWSISAGALPAGLSLAGTGTISGTPTTAGTSDFTIQVTDGAATTTQTLSVRVGLLPLTITTSSLPNGYTGISYSYTLAVVGGNGTYTWSIVDGSLPVGLSLASGTGVISGTPTNVGTANFAMRVADGVTTVTTPLSISINPVAAITITTASLPNGAVDITYMQTLAVSGGRGNYTWSISAGALPAGLSFAGDTGVISGKPTAAGTTSFTVQVSDGITKATRVLSITVNPPLTITTTSLPASHVSVAYSQTLAASGGNGIYTWSISGGSLPTGLSLVPATGVISGTPTAAGNFSFTVQAADGIASATKLLSIKVNAALTINTVSLANGDVGVAYSQTLTAAGGTGTYTWSITAGPLPDGLTLNAATGIISGTPTDDIASSLTVRVEDGVTAVTRVLSIRIYPLLTITTTSLPNSNVGVAYSQTLAASGGTGTYTWSIATGSLPAALSLVPATGVISGTPTAAGTFNFTIRVADGITAVTTPLSIKVNPVLAITTTSLPNSDVGVAYLQTLVVSGGSGVYTWSLLAGSLPAGLSLPPSTGIISGMPTVSGTTNFTVQVADGITTATRVLSITINPALTITITATALPEGNRGAAYSQTLTASGGSGIYTWSLASGSLPAGLSLNAATGTISGTPTTAGVFNFTVRVADGITTTTKFLSITIQ